MKEDFREHDVASLRWERTLPKVDVEAMQRLVAEGIEVSERRDWAPGVGFRVSKSLRRWMGYAAAGCLFALSVVSWRIFWPSSGTFKSDTYKTYITNAGQRASLTLGDGSRVTLGPATTLRVHNVTSQAQEIAVEVDGEALFNVTHGIARPFTVTAHGVTTRVLGTEFVVRAYDASHVRVAVRDGRVSVQSSVSTPANAAIVNTGEAAIVTPSTLPTVTTINDLATDFAWANGQLVLRNVPLGEAFVRLSRWYGIEFRVSDSSLLKSRVDAAFPAVFSRMEIDVLAEAIGARVTRAPGAITFSEVR